MWLIRIGRGIAVCLVTLSLGATWFFPFAGPLAGIGVLIFSPLFFLAFMFEPAPYGLLPVAVGLLVWYSGLVMAHRKSITMKWGWRTALLPGLACLILLIQLPDPSFEIGFWFAVVASSVGLVVELLAARKNGKWFKVF